MGYHDDTSEVTKTALNVFCDSPVEYYHQFVTKTMPRKKATTEMVEGFALHGMFLEKKRLDEMVGIYPASCLNKNGGLIGANAEKHRLANPGLQWLKQKEADAIQATFDRLQGTAITDAISQCTHFESEFKANVYGIPSKCKPDILGNFPGKWVVYDLKFCERISPSVFGKSSRTLRYWLQDAHYSAVLQSIERKPVVFKFIAAEVKFPRRVHIYSYNEIKREMAAKYHKSKMLQLAACMASNVWEDKWTEDLPLSEWDCECGDVLWDDEAIDDMNEPVEETEEMEMPF